jgi:hypothetical protein
MSGQKTTAPTRTPTTSNAVTPTTGARAMPPATVKRIGPTRLAEDTGSTCIVT